MRAFFIRHGQSTGNAGIPCHDLALIELTELGWQQAREVAAEWSETPDLIVTSPFLRTQQTAAPTLERFPDVPVEVWPIEEFTYLQPSRWNGTLSAERMPHIERYWAEADPEFSDGEGAESFSALLARAKAALERLEAMPKDALVYLFSHGQFIQALRSVVIDAALAEREKMRRFWGKGSPAIANAESVELSLEGGVWRHLGPAFSTVKSNAWRLRVTPADAIGGDHRVHVAQRVRPALDVDGVWRKTELKLASWTQPRIVPASSS